MADPARRIILLDDNTTVRRVLADMLRRSGHEALPAERAEQALDWLARGEAVDLLVADLDAPGMDGWALVRAIRKRYPALRIGVITGRALPPVARRPRCDFLLRRPIELRTFLDAVAGALPASAPSPGLG
jgi:CheY-like chemotaxis protein